MSEEWVVEESGIPPATFTIEPSKGRTTVLAALREYLAAPGRPVTRKTPSRYSRHRTGPYYCARCGQLFATLYGLRMHRTRVHGGWQ